MAARIVENAGARLTNAPENAASRLMNARRRATSEG
jgi:hypothetical protein